MRLPDLAFAASAGMLATINPCAFPLLPGFAAYFVGADGAANQTMPARILRGLGAGLAVAAGLAPPSPSRRWLLHWAVIRSWPTPTGWPGWWQAG